MTDHITPAEYDAAVDIVTAALRDSIGAHGPINRRYSRSAAKRIVHALTTAPDKPEGEQ